ncbi:MAG: 1,4-dihydroxy-2-naphthoate octaprenyltransferase [Bacteroidales bacterium]|nr:1,4-dihydroxy-2-naphthoate octaprenyltransferase [Bacteroidales bacterium]
MRLRTLPLSLAGITAGTLLAVADYRVKPLTVLFLALTTVSLQILSNLCNELGDSQHGTDRADREGIRYALQDGLMTEGNLKALIAGAVVACVLFGSALVYCAFGSLFSLDALMFLLLGLAAIVAAMRYTLGRNPYGYRGLGDLYVFVFFGLVTVLGAYFLCAGELPSWKLLLPASAVGLLSVGVLNVNNLRDIRSDAATRTTVAIRLGVRGARIYQTLLLAGGWACALAYCLLRVFDPWHYLFVLTLPLFVLHVRGVWTREGGALDPMLPLLVLSSFGFALLYGLGFVSYLL